MSDEPSRPRRALATLWRWIGHGLTAIALLLDALFAPLIDPVTDWLSRKPLVQRAGRWIASLPPYAVLVMVAVPVIVRQAIKFFALYWMATEDPIVGGLAYLGSRIANLLLVTRIYDAGRDKLLAIPWFKKAHDWLERRSERRLAAFRKTAADGWMRRWLGVGG